MYLISNYAFAVSCPALEAPMDGKKFGTKYLVDHEVHFTCKPGFQLIGSSTRVCQANGSWTGEEPQCKGTFVCSFLWFEWMSLSSCHQVGLHRPWEGHTDHVTVT